MLLSKPSCIVHWSSLAFNLWMESLRVEMITFHSQLVLKLDATHSSALSWVQLHPEATNLYLTRNRQTSPAVEKYLRNNTWMTKDLRLQSQWECRQRKTFDLWAHRDVKVGARARDLGLSPTQWFTVSTQWQHLPFFHYCSDVPVHSTPV